MELNVDTESKANGFLWDDPALKKKYKRVSKAQLREMGIKADSLRKVDTLEDLRRDPPNIIIASAVKNTQFIQNYFKVQTLEKKCSYVMGLGVYQQLHYDLNSKTKILKPAKMKFRNLYNYYNGEPLDNKTILVFRTGGIGDLLFIQPNLNYLKEKYPTCKIKFACGPQYQAMVKTWDCIDELLDLPFPAHHMRESDYHVLFEGVIERCKEAHTKNAYNLFSEWMGLNLPDNLLIPKQKPVPEMVEKCQKIVDEWGIADQGFILSQVRASSPVRTPRHQFWVELFDLLTDRGHNIVLTDNPRQTDSIEEFIKMSKNSDKIFNFARHSEALDSSIALTSLSKATLTTDSAFGHIAASLNLPSFGIYGPFPGYIRLKTYPKADWIDAQRHCAPCFIHGHLPCPEASSDGYSPCYDGINKNEVVERLEKLING